MNVSDEPSPTGRRSMFASMEPTDWILVCGLSVFILGLWRLPVRDSPAVG